jgi:hypothetical protein
VVKISDGDTSTVLVNKAQIRVRLESGMFREGNKVLAAQI